MAMLGFHFLDYAMCVAISDVLFKSLRRAGWICDLEKDEKAEVQGLDL